MRTKHILERKSYLFDGLCVLCSSNLCPVSSRWPDLWHWHFRQVRKTLPWCAFFILIFFFHLRPLATVSVIRLLLFSVVLLRYGISRSVQTWQTFPATRDRSSVSPSQRMGKRERQCLQLSVWAIHVTINDALCVGTTLLRLLMTQWWNCGTYGSWKTSKPLNWHRDIK